jgi:hypothetical protein
MGWFQELLDLQRRLARIQRPLQRIFHGSEGPLHAPERSPLRALGLGHFGPHRGEIETIRFAELECAPRLGFRDRREIDSSTESQSGWDP